MILTSIFPENEPVSEISLCQNEDEAYKLKRKGFVEVFNPLNTQNGFWVLAKKVDCTTDVKISTPFD